MTMASCADARMTGMLESGRERRWLASAGEAGEGAAAQDAVQAFFERCPLGVMKPGHGSRGGGGARLVLAELLAPCGGVILPV